MACTMINRLLHLHRRPSAPSPPSAPSFTFFGLRRDNSAAPSMLPASPSTQRRQTSDLGNWGAMAGQGSSSLAIRNLPLSLDRSLLDRNFRYLDGFLRITVVESNHALEAYIDFATNADAAKAMAENQIVQFGNDLYTTVAVEDGLPTPPLSRDQEIFHPRKKAKKSSDPSARPQCQICTSVIEGPHSVPCRVCRGTWCFDCVKTAFIGATHDHDLMPAKCCGKVFHYGVAGGILESVEYELYKMKYEEFCTSNPMYCPIPTCSAFIPPRLIKPVEDKISCHLCTISICIKCKQPAEEDHKCAPTDASIAKIKNLDYKLCPKCGTGVMKMFGCPHVRCAACGAHFCYDCRRPINACHRSPCMAAQDDGLFADDEDEEESDIEAEAADNALIAFSTPQWPADLREATRRDEPVQKDPETANLGESLGAEESAPLDSVPADLEERVRVEADSSPVAAARVVLAAAEANNIARLGQIPAIVIPVEAAVVMAPLDETPVATVESDEVVEHPVESAATPRSVRSASPSPQDSQNRESNEGTETPRPSTGTPATLRPIPDEPTTTSNGNDQNIDGNTRAGFFTLDFSPVFSSDPEVVSDHPDENTNLDDPFSHDWEAASLDFGAEPEDESWDVWGCEHHYRELRKEIVDPSWIHKTERYLECMRCFGGCVLFERGKGKKKDEKGEQEKHKENGGKKRKEGEIEEAKKKGKMAWECQGCGVVHCGGCREEARRLMKRDRKRERDRERDAR